MRILSSLSILAATSAFPRIGTRTARRQLRASSRRLDIWDDVSWVKDAGRTDPWDYMDRDDVAATSLCTTEFGRFDAGQLIKDSLPSTDVVIPTLWKGCTVTSISKLAFRFVDAPLMRDYVPSITSVVIPDSVITISQEAFSNQMRLNSVTIGNSVTSIGLQAFGFTKLTSVTIPDSVTSIGGSAFFQTPLTSVTIGNSVTSIGRRAFYDTQLTSVIIPESVTYIGDEAFLSRDSKLTSVTMSDSTDVELGTDPFPPAATINRDAPAPPPAPAPEGSGDGDACPTAMAQVGNLGGRVNAAVSVDSDSGANVPVLVISTAHDIAAMATSAYMCAGGDGDDAAEPIAECDSTVLRAAAAGAVPVLACGTAAAFDVSQIASSTTPASCRTISPDDGGRQEVVFFTCVKQVATDASGLKHTMDLKRYKTTLVYDNTFETVVGSQVTDTLDGAAVVSDKIYTTAELRLFADGDFDPAKGLAADSEVPQDTRIWLQADKLDQPGRLEVTAVTLCADEACAGKTQGFCSGGTCDPVLANVESVPTGEEDKVWRMSALLPQDFFSGFDSGARPFWFKVEGKVVLGGGRHRRLSVIGGGGSAGSSRVLQEQDSTPSSPPASSSSAAGQMQLADGAVAVVEKQIDETTKLVVVVTDNNNGGGAVAVSLPVVVAGSAGFIVVAAIATVVVCMLKGHRSGNADAVRADPTNHARIAPVAKGAVLEHELDSSAVAAFP